MDPFLQREYFRSEEKKWTPPLNSEYSNKPRYQVLHWTNNFDVLDQICPKRVFAVENEKSEKHHRILHIQIRPAIKFQLELAILTFWMKFKGISRSEQKKWTPPLHSAYSNNSGYQISAWTANSDFMDQICSERLFPVLNRKSKHCYWILHIRISLGIKFYLKLTTLNFWTKFPKKPSMAQLGHVQNSQTKMLRNF